MAPETLTEYERRRMENIRRNGEVMASLMLPRIASDLSSSSAPQSTATKTTKTAMKRPRPSHSPSSAPGPPSPVVLRRSLRTRGLPPPPYSSSSSSSGAPSAARRRIGPFPTADALVVGPGSSDRCLINAILGASRASGSDDAEGGGPGFDPRRSMVLREGNVRKVLPERILAVRFLPFGDRTVIAAGNKLGHLGFWDVDRREGGGDGDGVYVYFPHRAPVSGISVHPDSPTKIFTSCYHGFVCLMDAESETFNMIHSSSYSIRSICQAPHDKSSLYLGEGGELKVFDARVGKVSGSWDLHEDRINTIDFHPENTNLFATSSTDGKACIWDLRRLQENKLECLRTVRHDRAVHSAYFSPGGSRLATTSVDDRVGILSGANFEDLFMIKHNNQTGRWLSSFRAIWGWGDCYLYLGNLRRAVDVISVADGTTTALESELLTSIPCRLAAHPHRVGSLACATAGGKVFLWTKS